MNLKKKQPTYEMIDISKIKVDVYQRDQELVRVKKIVNEFDITKLKVIQVSLRDGKYWVVDGQHRILACNILGIKRVMCEVYTDLTYEEEAEMFAAQSDNVKRISLVAKFKAKTEAGNNDNRDIINIFTKNGFLLKSNGGLVKNRIGALTTIQKIVKENGLNNLSHVLSLIRKTWDGIAESTNSKILYGISMFIKNISILDEELFVKKLKTISPNIIIRDGDAFGNKDIAGFNKHEYIIKSYYEKGMRNVIYTYKSNENQKK